MSADENTENQIAASNAALAKAKARFFKAGDFPVTPEQQKAVELLQAHVIGLAAAIEQHIPDGRNKALALTALEEVQMRAGRAVWDPTSTWPPDTALQPGDPHYAPPQPVMPFDGSVD
jgi:hypothetical protein